MRLAVFSDIHGNVEALNAIMSDIKKNKIDKIICLGDSIGIGPNSKECLDVLINNKVETVLGNYELYFLYGTDIDDKMPENVKSHHAWIKSLITEQQKIFLKKLKLTISLNIDNKNFLFEHFPILSKTNGKYPFEDSQILKDNRIRGKYEHSNFDFIFFGHEHNAAKYVVNDKKIINVGSSGLVKSDETFYTIIDTSEKVFVKKVFVKFDREKFNESIRNVSYPDREVLAEFFFGLKI